MGIRKIDLNKKFVDLNKKEFEEKTLGMSPVMSDYLANILANSTQRVFPDILKCLDKAFELKETGILEIDEQDLKILTQYIQDITKLQAAPLISGQLFRALAEKPKKENGK